MGLTLTPRHDIAPALLSNEYIAYQNVAVTLQERHLTISTLQDLSGKSIIAFQTAKSILGEAFFNVVDQQPTYLELAEQKRQVSLLLLGSVDVAILDRNIFHYIKSQFPKKQQYATQIHEIFPVSTYSAAIPDPALRHQFNTILARFIADGRYQALLDNFGLENLLFILFTFLKSNLFSFKKFNNPKAILCSLDLKVNLLLIRLRRLSFPPKDSRVSNGFL